MVNRINIGNYDLLILLEFDDDRYKKIIMCLDEKDKRVFVINNKVITDNKIIDEINKKYNLEVPNELKVRIF